MSMVSLEMEAENETKEGTLLTEVHRNMNNRQVQSLYPPDATNTTQTGHPQR